MIRFLLVICGLVLGITVVRAQPTTTESGVAPSEEIGGGRSNVAPDSALASPKPPSPRTDREDLEPMDFVVDGDAPAYDPAELISHVEYPPEAAKSGVEGEVVMQVVVEKDGSVSKVKVIWSTNKIFDQAAIDAVKQTHFTPGKQDGKPLRVVIAIPVKFKLK